MVSDIWGNDSVPVKHLVKMSTKQEECNHGAALYTQQLCRLPELRMTLLLLLWQQALLVKMVIMGPAEL